MSRGARQLQQRLNGVPDAFSRSHRRQLERHHEGHPEGRLRRSGRLREELLREHHHSPDIFCNFRADGAVRSRQRRRRRAHETPRGKPQTGKNVPRLFQFQVEKCFIKFS